MRGLPRSGCLLACGYLETIRRASDCVGAAVVLLSIHLSGAAMATNPLPLSDAPADAPPDEAEYDAICATLAASTPGRRFLAEYAKRQRRADARTLARPLAALARDISALSAIVGRIEAVLPPSSPLFVDGVPAADRLVHFATMLREQHGDVALGAELEAVAREIRAAWSGGNAIAGEVQSAAALLEALVARVNTLMAVVFAGPDPDDGALHAAAPQASNKETPRQSDCPVTASAIDVSDLLDLRPRPRPEPQQAVPTIRETTAGESASAEPMSTPDRSMATSLSSVADADVSRPLYPDAGAAAARAGTTAASGDPLAALRGLSEEELIALFS